MDPAERKFRIPGNLIKSLIPEMGGAIASDRILVGGRNVGYMYREEPAHAQDSGWHFFAGDESQEYADNPDNFSIYEVNTICNYDPAIIPYLGSKPGTAFGRIEGSDQFALEEPPENAEEE